MAYEFLLRPNAMLIIIWIEIKKIQADKSGRDHSDGMNLTQSPIIYVGIKPQT